MSAWLASPSQRKVPLIIAHRGASLDRPENSLSAFRLALEQGADGLECDVQLSADGVPIILHDATVNRTVKSGKGRVHSLTLAQMQQFHLIGADEPPPTLESLFETLGNRTRYNLELKSYTWRQHDLHAQVLAIVKAFSLEKQVLVSSFFPQLLRPLRSQLATGLIRYKAPFTLTRYLYQGAADHPWRQLVNERYMRWARQNNLMVNVWTVDSVEEASRLAKLGVDSIITNRPGVLKSYFDANLPG